MTTLRIIALEDGPFIIKGKLGNTPIALCRCGASKNKPYCDGAHTSKYDFKAVEAEVEVEVE